jgi:hypothetical protein
VRSAFFKLLPLLLGTLIVSLIQSAYEGGGLFKFVEVQKYWGHVLSIPHNLGDWSHEGFGVSMGIIFLISIPLLVFLIQAFSSQLIKIKSRTLSEIGTYTPANYIQVMSVFYVIGTFLFILLFQGGGINGLMRYTLCSPFFFSLLFFSFHYVREIPKGFRFFIFSSLAVLAIIFVGLTQYSTYWNFSDLGLFILLATVFLWLFQDMSGHKLYNLGLVATVFANVLWTAYLFNTYIASGWIFT